MAAQAADDVLERLQAFHQAVWSAVRARPERHPWREISPLVGIPWQTLYRQYRQPPERFPRSRVSVDEHGSVGQTTGYDG